MRRSARARNIRKSWGADGNRRLAPKRVLEIDEEPTQTLSARDFDIAFRNLCSSPRRGTSGRGELVHPNTLRPSMQALVQMLTPASNREPRYWGLLLRLSPADTTCEGHQGERQIHDDWMETMKPEAGRRRGASWGGRTRHEGCSNQPQRNQAAWGAGLEDGLGGGWNQGRGPEQVAHNHPK